MDYLRTAASSTAQSMLGGVLRSFSNASAQIFEVPEISNRSNGLSMFALSLISLAVASICWLYISTKKSGPPLPPGDLGFPFMGDTFSYITAHHNMDTVKWFKQKREKYGPIFKTRILGRRQVFMDAPDGFKLAFRPPEEKLMVPILPDSMAGLLGPFLMRMITTPERPRPLRKFLMETFLGLNVVHQFLPTIERKTVDHIQQFWLSEEDGAELKSLDLLQFFTFSVIGVLVMGINDQPTLRKMLPIFWLYNDGMFCVAVNLPGFQLYRSMKARKQIQEILQESIERRRQELREGKATPREDLLSIFLTHPNGHGHLHTDGEIRDSLLMLMWAGFETSAGTLAMVLRHLSRNPDVYRELIKENTNIAANKAEGEPLNIKDIRAMKYTWAVCQETLRVTPPNPDISRQAMSDLQYKGFTIPKGYKLTCSAAQGMWNPNLYPNPDKFDPTRFLQSSANPPPPNTFIPFGGADRMCAGIEFAKLSMLTFLHHFLRNIKWSLVDPQEKLLYKFLLYPEKGLPITIQKCKLY